MKFKSVIAAIMLVVCIFTLLPTSVSADTEQIRTIVTGDPSRQEPTKNQLVAVREAVTQYLSIFVTEPSLQAPYTTGKLSADFLQNGEDYLNYIRYIAHLPEVQLKDALNENAQYGAVILAVNQELTHYPSAPADMDNAFFRNAYAATTSSNLGYGYTDLQDHIQGCIDDTSNYNNLVTLGHRRWLLCSQLKNVGFGYAKSNAPYTATKVFDKSGSPINYDVIAWPASGNMPSDLFHCDVPWSITINTNRYTRAATPVEIRVINRTTGQIWSFNEQVPGEPHDEDAYYLQESSGYGDRALTYIFRPDYHEMFEYTGTYTVEIHGWADIKKPNQPLLMTYDISFFDPSGYEPPVITAQPQDQYAQLGETASVSIDATGWDINYHWWIKAPGNEEFVATNVTADEYSVFVTNLTNGTQLYCEVTDSKGAAVNSNIVTIHCTNPVENPGDLDGIEGVDNRDVEYLLWYTLFPEDYPLINYGDFDGDGIVDNKDVEYLLWHTLFPEDYPLA